MSDQKDDGGPAFARPCSPPASVKSQDGMSLRDLFAAAALQGMLAAREGYDVVDDKYLAFDAYAFADAMLEARK